MNCETARGEMHRSLDAGGEHLPASVNDHLNICEACRTHWRQLCRIEDALADTLAQETVVPEHIHSDLMERLRREEIGEPASHRSGVLRWVLAAAAVLVLLAVVSTLVYSPQPTPPRQASGERPSHAVTGVSPASVVTGLLLDPIPDMEELASTRVIAEAGATVREFGLSILSPASAALRALQAEEAAVRPESTPRVID